MKRRSGILSTIILIAVFFIGLAVMLYPTISDLLNSRQQKKSIIEYDRSISQMEDNRIELMLKRAQDYNARLAEIPGAIETEAEDIPGYDDILDVTGTGIIGYINIKKINTALPVYHGTSDAVLNVAVGHIKGSSFPIGGESSHAVISAHRGLPSAKLFSDLDQINIGDTFEITVLDKVLKYCVDKISIVEPEDMTKLHIVKGKDYVTLVTCTPYGVNTHRLLVRGERVDDGITVNVESDAFQIEPLIVAPILAVPLILMLIIIFTTGSFRRKRRRRKQLVRLLVNKNNSEKGGGDG